MKGLSNEDLVSLGLVSGVETFNKFGENPDNAKIEAMLVFWGYRDEARTDEAKAMVDAMIKEYGVKASSVYGDEAIKTPYWDYGVPEENITAKIDMYYATEEVEGHDVRGDILKGDPILQAAMVLQNKLSYPRTNEGWDALKDILKLNTMDWDDVYGEGTTDEVISQMKEYRTLEDLVSQYAYRASHLPLEEWLIKNRGYTKPIAEILEDASKKTNEKITRMIEEEGW